MNLSNEITYCGPSDHQIKANYIVLQNQGRLQGVYRPPNLHLESVIASVCFLFCLFVSNHQYLEKHESLRECLAKMFKMFVPPHKKDWTRPCSKQTLQSYGLILNTPIHIHLQSLHVIARSVQSVIATSKYAFCLQYHH